MSAESLFPPIPTEAIRAARSRLALAGLSVEEWAQREGYKAKTVYNVLSGSRPCIRGVMLQIAVKLGLRDLPAPQQGFETHDVPAGRTVAGGAPDPDRNRRPVSSLGAPVL